MAIFPAIAPIHSAPKQTAVSGGKFTLGDGYQRATQFGINSIRPDWNLTWEVSAADASAIDAFLQARANAGDSFDWQPPDAATTVRWRCDEWSVEQTAHDWFRVSGSFRRVFELSVPASLAPAATTCIDDELCEPDIGPNIVDAYRYWYRLLPAGTGSQGSIACIADTDGAMYVARMMNFASGMHPVVYKISNEVTQIWSVRFTLDPARTAATSGYPYDTYYLLNSGETYFDFLAWQLTAAGTYPARIYRYRVSKIDGSIINVLAVDWTPPGSPSNNYFTIKDAKIDRAGNYYFVGVFPVNTELGGIAILKFTSDFQFAWSRGLQQVTYRGTGKCGVSSLDIISNLGMNVSDEGIIACVGIGGTSARTTISYCRLDLDGNTLGLFKPKFASADYESNPDCLIPVAVCRDPQGNVYGFGSYDPSGNMGTFGGVLVYKESNIDQTIWAKDIRPTLVGGGVGPLSKLGEGNFLLWRDNKLILAGARNIIGGFGTTQQPILFVFNALTGDIIRIVKIDCPTDAGNSIIIQPMPEPTKFIVQTEEGFVFRLDVNNLPLDGTYAVTGSPSNSYTVSTVTPLVNDAVFYKFADCSTPNLSVRNVGAYFFPATPVVTVAAAPTTNFNYFGGQDLPPFT